MPLAESSSRLATSWARLGHLRLRPTRSSTTPSRWLKKKSSQSEFATAEWEFPPPTVGLCCLLGRLGVSKRRLGPTQGRLGPTGGDSRGRLGARRAHSLGRVGAREADSRRGGWRLGAASRPGRVPLGGRLGPAPHPGAATSCPVLRGIKSFPRIRGRESRNRGQFARVPAFLLAGRRVGRGLVGEPILVVIT